MRTFYITVTEQGFSCVDLQNAGMRQSGVYYLQIRGTTYWFLKVFCEQEIADGGWTVSANSIPSAKHTHNHMFTTNDTGYIN